MKKQILTILALAVLSVYPLLAEGTCNCSTSSQDESSCTASAGANCNSDNKDVITASDYAAFLTAVASTSDPNSYYDETMAGDTTSPALIIRTEDSNGGYVYSVASGQENIPITLTQEEAAAYTDWVNQDREKEDIKACWFYCSCGGVRDCDYCPPIWGMCPCS